MLPLPQFDELYVVSDIHMGGAPGFQILREGPRLGKLIQTLATIRPDERVGLVLNGDVIDSLAEDIDGYIAIDDADRMMARLYDDPTFAPVWDGLAFFVRQPGRRLVIGLGNHDIEMALPLVEASIRRRLARGDDTAEGRIAFATQGAGFGCLVGRARVFCTHGNEVDAWNLIDHDSLRSLAMSQSAGTVFDRTVWEPNAGTQLVKDVMNGIKQRYAWIDLLKPETEAALGVLLVLDPGQALKVQRIRGALSAYVNRMKGGLKMSGWLSVDRLAAAPIVSPQAVPVEQMLGPQLLSALRGSGPAVSTDADAMLRDAELAVSHASDRRAIDTAPRVETLGMGQWMWDRMNGVEPAEALRCALKDWLKDDTTWDIAHADETCREVMKHVGPLVDFVVTGHTHLERALRVAPEAERYYYNCGTWIRLLRLTDAVLASVDTFRDVYQTLANGRMSAIDSATIPSAAGSRDPFVIDRSSLVRISARADGTVGTLFHVLDAGAAGVLLEPVPGSEFLRK